MRSHELSCILMRTGHLLTTVDGINRYPVTCSDCGQGFMKPFELRKHSKQCSGTRVRIRQC